MNLVQFALQLVSNCIVVLVTVWAVTRFSKKSIVTVEHQNAPNLKLHKAPVVHRDPRVKSTTRTVSTADLSQCLPPNCEVITKQGVVRGTNDGNA